MFLDALLCLSALNPHLKLPVQTSSKPSTQSGFISLHAGKINDLLCPTDTGLGEQWSLLFQSF